MMHTSADIMAIRQCLNHGSELLSVRLEVRTLKKSGQEPRSIKLIENSKVMLIAWRG